MPVVSQHQRPVLAVGDQPVRPADVEQVVRAVMNNGADPARTHQPLNDPVGQPRPASDSPGWPPAFRGTRHRRGPAFRGTRRRRRRGWGQDPGGIEMDNHRRPLITAQAAGRILPISQRRQGDLGQPHQRISGACPLGSGNRLDRGVDDRAPLRIQPCAQPPSAVGSPGSGHILGGLRLGLVVIDGAQAADQHLQLGGRAVPGCLDQIIDERGLTGLVKLGDPADRACLRIRQPPRSHLGG